MNGDQKKRLFGILFSIVFAFIVTTVLWMFLLSTSDPSTSPEDYLGHWALDKKSYIVIKKDTSTQKETSDIELSPDYDAELLLPVKVSGKIVFDFLIIDYDFKFRGRGGIYLSEGKHVLKMRNDCIPMALRRDGQNLEMGYSNGANGCDFTPKSLNWYKYWSTKKKKKKKR